MNSYRNSRGWLYRVRLGLGGKWRAQVLRPGKTRWESAPFLRWRTNQKDAEQDLLLYAARHCMTVVNANRLCLSEHQLMEDEE